MRAQSQKLKSALEIKKATHLKKNVGILKPGIPEIFIIPVKSVPQLPRQRGYFLISASRLPSPGLRFSLETGSGGGRGDLGVLGWQSSRRGAGGCAGAER